MILEGLVWRRFAAIFLFAIICVFIYLVAFGKAEPFWVGDAGAAMRDTEKRRPRLHRFQDSIVGGRMLGACGCAWSAVD